MNQFLVLILDPLKHVFSRFAGLFPNVLAMLVILLVGLVAVRIFSSVLMRLFRAVDFNSWSDRAGFTSLLRKGDVWARPARVVTRFLSWIMIVLVFLAGLTVLHIPLVDTMIARVLGYLPRALSAVFILVLGYTGMGLVERSLLIFMVNSGYRFARHVSRAARLVMSLLITAMALEQLDVAPHVVVAAFSIIFGGVVLALAISFGIAGVEVAKKMLQKEEKKQDTVASDIQHL